MRRTVQTLVVAGVTGLCSVTGVARAADGDAVALGFAAAPTGLSGPVSLLNEGNAVATVQVVSSGGGSLRSGASATDAGGAVAFPDYTTGKVTAPRAVIAVSNAGATDQLSPGDGGFGFGADAWLNAVNRGGPADNGNNVVQRGLFGTGAQYKLELDKAKANCRLEGTSGVLAAYVVVPTQAWYRLSCAVSVMGSVDTLTISAQPISATGALGVAQQASATGPVGRLTFLLQTPLSVGGKLNNNLTLQSSADQFNGRVDNAWLRLAP